MRRSILACGLLLAFAGMATAAAAATASKTSQGSTNPAISTTSSSDTTPSTTTGTTAASDGPSRWELRTEAIFRRHIRRFRLNTLHWQTVMQGHPPAPVSRSLATHSLARLEHVARQWRHRAHQAWWQANHPPALGAWLCIHHYEGSWTDSGSPYWGGLQMDLSFQRTYGGWLLSHKGTADHWSPLEQIWVAVRASHSRGFSPWPNTARDCGVY